MNEFKGLRGRTAVLTGAASGFGLECARIAAREGMNVVLVDVQNDALQAARAEIEALAAATGGRVIARRVDVSKAEAMQALADEVMQVFGAPSLVFNNAGVGSGGLVWENSVKDWEWVLGVNIWGVVHGVRLFTPMMLAAADLGIGSGHAAIGDQEACRRILRTPTDHICAYMLAFGYPADRPLKPIAKPNRRPIAEVVHRGRW